MSESRSETFFDWVRQVYQDFWERPRTVTIDHVVREEIVAILGGDMKEGEASETSRLLVDDVEPPTQDKVPAELARWLEDPRLDPPRRRTPRDV